MKKGAGIQDDLRKQLDSTLIGSQALLAKIMKISKLFKWNWPRIGVRGDVLND